MRVAYIKVKMEDRKKQYGDLGMVEDIFELCKNLTSIEAHAFGSYVSSQDDKWIKVCKEARKIRTKYLAMITKKDNQQGWCISKHLSESAMRLQEVYTRFLSTNQIEEAKQVVEDYFAIYYMFLEINGIDKQEFKVTSSA